MHIILKAWPVTVFQELMHVHRIGSSNLELKFKDRNTLVLSVWSYGKLDSVSFSFQVTLARL